MMIRSFIFVLALAACAANPALPTMSPRDGCPDGAVLRSNARGTACWPRNMAQPPAEHCRPVRSSEADYMIWNCSALTPVRDAQGNPIGKEFVSHAGRQLPPVLEQYRVVYMLRGTSKSRCECQDRPQGVDLKVDCRNCTCVEDFPD